MRAFASSFHAWRSLERQEGIKVPHGLVFSLAVVEAIGRPHGLELVAQEHEPAGPAGYDAVMLSVLDSRCLVSAATHFRGWGMPFRRAQRPVGAWPLVWAGGQGLHNPLPLADVADLVVIGDAEAPLPVLLDAWHSHGNSESFLDEAARVPGVYVPSRHDRRHVTVTQAVAADITVTLANSISVSHDGTRRLEIARGCRYKCTFCSLGWRTPLRENTPDDVVAALATSPRRVHLQAGDAESHTGITAIRTALHEAGGYDQGWTGRLDSLLDNPDMSVPGQKRYAFGVEGVSHRLRRAVGKGYLTDERLVADTVRFFATVEGDTWGRAAWHMMSGLPTERPAETLALAGVLTEVDRRHAGHHPRNLAIHWQPFQPLPGTPMQWCPAGAGARRQVAMLRGLERLAWVRVSHVGGRTDAMAQLCTVLSRSDERGADLLEAIAARGRSLTLTDAVAISGATAGQLDPDTELAWDFVRQWRPKTVLRSAYEVMLRRLAEG
jgi:hypothetical protein